MKNYKHKRITIIGLGITGISCINFFIKKKSDIYIMDNNINININNIKISKKKINLGSLKISWILKSDLLVLSPGVSLNTPEILIAKKYNIDIVNDIEIFFREKLNSLNILITGSNGKSTVTTLIYKIIKKSKIKVAICGNIGIPILNLIDHKYKIYVIELSSFQLELIKTIYSKISIILNISNNHIDRHINMLNYIDIKHKIYNNCSNYIFNYDDINTWPKLINKKTNYISFGLNNGDYFLKKNNSDFLICEKSNVLFNCKYFKLKGINNYLNFLVSISVTKLLNIDKKHQFNVFKNFYGLKHRFNIIKKNNIICINDSKSTNQNSTIVAIKNIESFNYVHLLLGGYNKGNDFNLLSKFIKNKRIILYFFGLDGKKMSKIFYNFYIYRENLESLIIIINKIIKKNDVILLSPASSSKDQYKSFEDRGNFFIKFIKKHIN